MVAMTTMMMMMITANTNTNTVLALATTKKVYRYFGYGSNVIPSTMKALRQIEVREVTAAVLPDYELKFTSAAFVRPVPVNDDNDKDKDKDNNTDNNTDKTLPRTGRVVHGLLYTLTEDEFAKVGQTEGVPFGYRWQSCLVYPYRGDGKQAGNDCMNMNTDMNTNTNTNTNDQDKKKIARTSVHTRRSDACFESTTATTAKKTTTSSRNPSERFLFGIDP